jgi:hypothetical protein
MLAGKHTVMALISPGAPSEVMVVGSRMPRLSMLRKKAVQHGWLSLLPTARCSRCLRPSEAIHQATNRASLAPWRRSDSKIASTNRYSTLISDKSRVMKAW